MLRSWLLLLVWVMGLPGLVYSDCVPGIQVSAGQVILTYTGCDTAVGSVSDHHGRRVDTARLQLIFWGHEWQTASNPSQADITAAVQSILRGPYLSRLSQYGFVSLEFWGAKSILSDPPATYVFSDISKAVWGAINAGALPQPNAGGKRVLYMVFMPSTSVYIDKTVFGAHDAVQCAQALQTDPRCSGATDAAWLAFATGGSTTTFSHELVETITDPEGIAWNLSTNPITEIGDNCNRVTDGLDGIQVQPYWSNVDKACVIPRGPINYQSAKPQTITSVSGPPAAAKTQMQHVYGRNASGETLHYKWSTCYPGPGVDLVGGEPSQGCEFPAPGSLLHHRQSGGRQRP